MADENYIDMYNGENGEEGMTVKGKDVVMLDAPEVLLSPDTPLLTTAQDIAGAINELFQSGAEGGDSCNGNLRAIIDDDTSSITIVVGEVPEGEEDEQYTDYCYAYASEDFSESVTVESTTTDDEGTETVTTSSETFTKRIVKELYNASGVLIMRADVADDGSINGYYDGDDLPIYLTEWRS